MYSFPKLEPVCCSMSSSNCCFLTCTNFSGGRSGGVVIPSLEDFPQFVVIHTVKGFGLINKADVDVFLEFSCFFYDPTDVGIWSLVPLPFLNPAWTSGSSWLTYSWSLAWRILSITLLAWLCDSLSILWHCLSLGLEWKMTVSSSVTTAEFSKFAGILSVALSQHHLSGFEIAQLKSHHLY